MRTTFTTDSTREIVARLRTANAAFAQAYPGASGDRQPVHTVYGGAHLFKADTAAKMGGIARRFVAEYFPDAVTLAKAVGLRGADRLPDAPEEVAALHAAWEADAEAVRRANEPAWMAFTVYGRVLHKLDAEPIEDFRIDYEDGYGNRPDAEEDAHAAQAAGEVARGLEEGTLPPFCGIRIKPFTDELGERSMRTLDIFVSTLLEKTGGRVPPGFVVTLPKVVLPEQVEALAGLFGLFEQRFGLAPRTLKLELMIETTQSLISGDGRITLPLLVRAADGRCTGAHFGTYDYTAGCSITAAYQTMTHPDCDFAKHVMKVSLSGTTVMLSDGATNIMPVPRHRPGPGAPPLGARELHENRIAVHAASRLHYEHIRHSLLHAMYQGWDLHPAQLPTRYAAVYAFFLEGLDAASKRLSNFMDKAAQATLVGDVFDDAATGQGLLNYFLRGMSCGALTEAEATATGLSVDELRTRSFVRILNARRAGGR